MRGRVILVFMALGATAAPDVASAQLSPQGIIGGITRPFRHALGAIGHRPRARHYHRAASGRAARAAAARAAAAERAAASQESLNTSGARLGLVGPPAWPSAYEDALGFTFWPDDYASRLRGHGFDVIADTISGRLDLRRSLPRTATTRSAVRTDADNDSALDKCGPSTSAINWPSSRVEQTVQLSGSQRTALEKVQTATAEAASKIKADCRGVGSLSPPDRLRALVQTLWTVRDGGVFLREPLKSFYETLTYAQKNSFTKPQPDQVAPADSGPANPGMNKQFQACAAQNAERAERLIKEIEMRVRPDKDQAQSFETFHRTASDMAKMLIASCAQPIPADPIARLDAANDHLTAMNYAATTVQITFDKFYVKLNNDQKSRFDAMASR
jgi:LTXXQ motif family protein